MSVKQMAYTIIEQMTSEELINFIKEYLGLDHIPNQDTLDALHEMRDMDEHPENYKTYSNTRDMFEDILND